MSLIYESQLTLPLIDAKTPGQNQQADKVLSLAKPKGSLVFVNVVDCGRVNALLIGQLLSSHFGNGLGPLPIVEEGQRGALITSSMKPDQQSFLIKKLTNPTPLPDHPSPLKIVNLRGGDLKQVSSKPCQIADYEDALSCEWDYVFIDDCRHFLGGAKCRTSQVCNLIEWSREQKAKGKVVALVQRAASKGRDLSHMLSNLADSTLTIRGDNRGRWLKELLYLIEVKRSYCQYEIIVRCKPKDGRWVWTSDVANFDTGSGFSN